MSTHSLVVYSVTPDEPSAEAFSISRKPARWTSGQWPVIYTSEHAAAALLEYRAHLQSTPGHCLRISQALLPELDIHEIQPDEELAWRERPYRAEVQALGDAWLQGGHTLAARVPSALCHGESNLLINPSHAAFARIRYLPSIRFQLDQRLL